MENNTSKEIERKFLISGVLHKELLDAIENKFTITQAFLSVDPDKVVRIRLSESEFEDVAYLTVKGHAAGDEGITRTEIETKISFKQAQQLINEFCGQKIEKIRYNIPCGGLTWEIDEFLGDNKGLWIAEVELASELQEFKKPSFIGKEVSTDKRYTNVALSLKPYSTWSEKDKE